MVMKYTTILPSDILNCMPEVLIAGRGSRKLYFPNAYLGENSPS